MFPKLAYIFLRIYILVFSFFYNFLIINVKRKTLEKNQKNNENSE